MGSARRGTDRESHANTGGIQNDQVAAPGQSVDRLAQNNAKKTTISPYSLRGNIFPTAAAPRTWDELATPGLRQLTIDEVLERLNEGLEPLANLLAEAPGVLANAVGAPTQAQSRAVLTVVGNRPRPVASRHQSGIGPALPGHGPRVLPAGLSGPVDVELAKAEETRARAARHARRVVV